MKIRSDMILHHLEKRHKEDVFLTEVKNGQTWFNNNRLRLDAVAIKKSWAKPCITAYEVKVDRNDFLRDEKWPGYRECCHKLSFACPEQLIMPEELPDDIGLVWYSQERDTIWTKRVARFRDIQAPWDMLYYLVTARTKSDRHPFFSSTREMVEAYLEDKIKRRDLGYAFKSKLVKTVQELEEANRDLERKCRYDDERKQQINRIQEAMRAAGYTVNSYADRWIDDLQAALSSKQIIAPTMAKDIEYILLAATRLSKQIQSVDDGEAAGL